MACSDSSLATGMMGENCRGLQWRALTGLLLFLWSGFGHACSCWRPSPQQLLEAFPLIFRGTVSTVDRNAGASVANFQVHKVYKGVVAGDVAAIRFNDGPGASCGVSFKEGETHTVFAGYRSDRGGRPMFSTGLCPMIPYRSSPHKFQPILDAYAIEVATARQATERQPDSVMAWDSLAAIHESNKDHFAALVSLEQLRVVSRDDAEVLARIGKVQLALARFEPALASFESALKRKPESSAAKEGRNQALLKLGRAGELDFATRSFSGMDLPAPDFSGKDLSGVDFSKSRMEKPIFEKADLTGANFEGARIRSGNFRGAKARNARFDGANVSEGNFENADLTSARLAGANLGSGNFAHANLAGANFDKAEMVLAIFSNANLQSASFKEASFYLADLSNADLSGHDLSGLQMQGARFVDAKLVKTNLSNALFSGPLRPYRNEESLHGPGRATDFRGADLTGANLAGADLRYAIFDCRTRWPKGFRPAKELLFPVGSRDCPKRIRTALFDKPGVLRERPGLIGGERSKIRGPEFEKLEFPEIDLSGAGLSGFQFWRVIFPRAKLVDVDFRNADLQHSDFSGADLTGADLSGATLWGCNFSGARLDGARLAGARYGANTVWPEGFDPVQAGAEKE